MQKSVSPVVAIVVILIVVAAVAFAWMRFTEPAEPVVPSTVVDGRGRPGASPGRAPGRGERAWGDGAPAQRGRSEAPTPPSD